MSSATRTRRVLFRSNFPTTLGRLKFVFWRVWPSVNHRGVTAKDVCQCSWLLQRILLCHCDPIVPAVPLREAVRRSASEQNHNSGMTTHRSKQFCTTIKLFVLVNVRFEHKTAEEHKILIQVSMFLSLMSFKRLWTRALLLLWSSFLVSWGNGLSKGPFDAVPLRGLGFRYDEDFQERGGLYLAFGCCGCSLHLCAISWAGVLDLAFERDSSRPSSRHTLKIAFLYRLKISYPCTWSLGLRTRCAVHRASQFFFGFRFLCKLQMAMLQWSKLEALPAPIEAAICWKLMFSASSVEKMLSANPNSWILDSTFCPKSEPRVSGQRQKFHEIECCRRS